MIRCWDRRRWFAALSSLVPVVALVVAPIVSAAPAPAPPQPGPSMPELYRRASPAVVFITQVDASGKATSLASGFVVSPNGVVVTNHHVINPDQGAVHIRVKVPRGDVYTDVRVIYAEERRDFAVLAIKAAGLPALPIGDSDKVEVGDRVMAIGNPQGLELTLTDGIVESVRLDPQRGYRFIQHQAPISPGSSGGPLLNMKGEVIGINAFGFRNAQNLNGAIPINYVKPYFSDPATVTWEEWGHVTGAAPPAAPPSPTGPPASAAWTPPQSFFEHVNDLRTSPDQFQLGFAAGVYDAVSMFAAAAQGTGLSSQATVGLFQCIDTKGDRLGELRGWVVDASQNASDGDAVVSVVVRACQRAFSPGSFFAHVSDFKHKGDDYQLGIAAGIYDAVSLFATGAQAAGGIGTRQVIDFFHCLDAKGDVLADFRTWVGSATRGAADKDAAVGVLAKACAP
ncbi:MAG TPA: trypsin-like peptidase domain-containing protein [bacterium]|nr:trypsin-like peptidase domain-containing protein [bacterium]